MSFTKFLQDDPLLTPEQCMSVLIQVANELDMPDKRAACVIAAMTMYTEVGVKDNDSPQVRFWCPANYRNPESFRFPHDSISDDNRSVGYFQQQKGPNGELWWGSTEDMMRLASAARTFMSRLRKLPYHIRDAKSAGQFAQAVQQSSFPDRYAEWNDEALALFDKLNGKVYQSIPDVQAPFKPPTPHHLGDPVWLKDVISGAGVNCVEAPGAQQRGHGDFGKIWGIIIHHTGGNASPVSEISHHPTLGLASQLHLAKDGKVTVCGVGIAWHAGYGSYPGLPVNAANGVTIGIECVNLPPKGAPHRTGWSDVQYTSMVKTCAAILVKLGHNSDRVISHEEWGGRSQGKWDPGSINMVLFRADVQREIDKLRSGGVVGVGVFMALSDQEQKELLDKTRQLWGALFNPVADTSIYGNPDPNHKIPNKDRLTYMDGNVWDLVVEAAARRNVPWAIEVVARTAAGDGPKGDTQWVKDQAQELLVSLGADRATVESLDD